MNKYSQSRLISHVLFFYVFAALILPGAFGGKKKEKTTFIKQKELPTTIVSKNENAFDAYSEMKDLLGVTAAEKNKRTAREIERWSKNKKALAADKAKVKKRIKRYKNVIRKQKQKYDALKRKQKKQLKNLKKTHTENQIKSDKKRMKSIAKRQNSEDVKLKTKLNAMKDGSTQKMKGYVGNTGQALSIIDAAKNAYYKGKDGKIHFSTTQYLKNVGKNLTGIAAVTGTVDAAVMANRTEFKRIIDAYKKKHNCDSVPPEIVAEATSSAFKMGLMVGTYNGAKCVPVLGDVIATGELIEASAGLYNDTVESNRIQTENKATQKVQGKTALRTLNAKYAEFKACKREFEKLQRNSDQMIKNFKSTRLQYIKVFSSAVKREKSFENGDALLKAAETAKPYMENNRVESLQLNAQKMSTAVTTTIKLAETTLENHATNGGDPNVLKSTTAELAKMMQTLVSYKKECDATTKVLIPLLNGGDTLENTKELAAAAEVDSIISADLYDTALVTLKAHRALVNRGKRLKLAQARILKETQRLRFHYFRAGDNETKTSVEIDYRNTLQYQIDDYPIKKLDEKHKTIVFEFNSLRGATQIPEELPPEIAEEIKKAAKLAPIIRELGDSLDDKIVTVLDMIARIGTQETLPPTKIPEEKSESIAAKFGNKDFADLSINKICIEAGFYNHVGSQKKKWTNGDLLYGFAYHKSNTNELTGTFNDPNVKPIPIYHGCFTKLIEKGDIEIWNDLNANNKKDSGEVGREPYWIWYKVNNYACNIWGAWYMWRDMKGVEKRCSGKLKRLVNINNFTSSNVSRGFTGSLKSDKTNIEGYAYTPPFTAGCGLQVIAQVGKFGLWLSKDGCLHQTYKRQLGAKAFNELEKKMAFWSTGSEKQLRVMLDSMLAFPKKYVDYSDQHFYRDPHVLLPNLNLAGFKMKYKRDSSNNLYRPYRKKFTLRGSRRTGYVSYTISIKIETPNSSKESWKDLLTKIPKRISSYKNDWKISVEADAFRASRCHRESYYSTDGSNEKIPLFYVAEQIYAVKSNVVVSVHGHCDNALTPDLETQNIISAILANVKKPKVK